MSRIFTGLMGALALATKPITIPAESPKPAKAKRPVITGSRLRHPDGTVYEITSSGAYRRTTPRRWEAKDRADLHNNSVRRRVQGAKGRV